MTALVSWNIQNGRGVDGRLDLDRCAAAIESFGETDVICLQEVIRFMPELDDGAGDDQVAVLGALFPGFEAVYGPAVERAGAMAGRRAQYGNLVLSRLPVLAVARHTLPQPAEPGVRSMPRQATEVTVAARDGPLRIVTTHLEFHSEAQRLAQAACLRALHREAAANASLPAARPETGAYAAVPRPARCILCGDFNALPDDAVHACVTAPFDDGTPPLLDAWRAAHGDAPRPPTCGVYDHNQWPEGPHCRDFAFVTLDIARRIERIEVALETAASDHQPLRLVIAD